MIFSLSLAHPPPPSLSPSPPPPPPPPLSLFPPDLILSSPFYSTHSVPLTCVLRSTLLLWQTPCYSFPLGSDTVFCHPVKPLIYCISQIGTLFIYILPFFFSPYASPSVIFLLPPSIPAISLSLRVQRIDWQQTVVAPRWRLRQFVKN